MALIALLRNGVLWMQVKENEGLNFLCSKAEVIDELETTVPDWVKAKNPGWYPAYVHILKVTKFWQLPALDVATSCY